jgi:protein-L-isoaspartate(D-aspartate) O-methyltransferase
MTDAYLDRVRADFAEMIREQASIRSTALIKALGTVRKEDFVGPGPWKIMRPGDITRGYQLTPDADPRHLYDTVLVALDADRLLNTGEPSGLMRWLDSLDLIPGDRFLHVGCGVGYYTAIIAEAVGPRGSVLGVEIDVALAVRAQSNLRCYPHARVISADGSCSMHSLFDAIFVNAGCTHIQSPWLDQLSVGGRLLVPLTVDLSMPGGGGGFMLLVTRKESGYEARFTTPVGIFHCVGARTEEGQTLLRKSLAGRNERAVRRLRRDVHQPAQDCWLHSLDFCLSLS